MRKLWALAEKLWQLMFPDHAGRTTSQSGSVLAGFAMPHTFGPNLSLGQALIAVVATLTRIFSTCLLFAVWGGAAAMAWTAIESHFWRAVALALLILVFLTVIATLMIAISAVEKMITPRR